MKKKIIALAICLFLSINYSYSREISQQDMQRYSSYYFFKSCWRGKPLLFFKIVIFIYIAQFQLQVSFKNYSFIIKYSDGQKL